MQAIENIYPEAALKFYQRYVAYLISRRNKQAYEQAIRFLQTVRTRYEQSGKSDAWMRYIARLREQHKSLKALQNMLSTAGL